MSDDDNVLTAGERSGHMGDDKDLRWGSDGDNEMKGLEETGCEGKRLAQRVF